MQELETEISARISLQESVSMVFQRVSTDEPVTFPASPPASADVAAGSKRGHVSFHTSPPSEPSPSNPPASDSPSVTITRGRSGDVRKPRPPSEPSPPKRAPRMAVNDAMHRQVKIDSAAKCHIFESRAPILDRTHPLNPKPYTLNLKPESNRTLFPLAP
jgi:hypothetical protein